MPMDSDTPQTLLEQAAAALDRGALEDAEQGFRQLLTSEPERPDAQLLLGETLRRRGKLGEAEDLIRGVLDHNRSSTLPYTMLHQTLIDAGRYDEALDLIDEAVALEPDNPDLNYTRALTLEGLGRLSEALNAVQQCLRLQPNAMAAASLEASVLRVMGHGEQAADRLRALIEQEPTNFSLWGKLILALHGDPRASLKDIADTTRKAWQSQDTLRSQNVSTEPDPNRKLKIAYVSGDFREHPVAYFLEGVLNAHDRELFHVTLVSNFPGSDERTSSLRQMADDWQPIFSLSDEDACKRLRELRIDIAIDLSGWTRGHRLTMFGRRVAPVQIGWIGYSGTTGLDSMDYVLSDEVVLPPGDEVYYSETALRLPHSYLSIVSPSPMLRERLPDIGPRAHPAAGQIVFGSFNNLAKLTDLVIDAWVQILSGVEGARLLLRARQLNDDGVRAALLARFTQRGLEPDRVILEGNATRKGMLASYRKVDIALDPFPYGGTTTTFEALCMGVPVVTFKGDRWVARVGSSILATVGLSDLVATSVDDYVGKAIALAQDLPRLTALRSSLETDIQASAICDTSAFTLHLEGALRQIWQRWCASQATE